MAKIAFIGAGSYGFTHRLLFDIISYDELRHSDFVFMDVDDERMRRLKITVKLFFDQQGLDFGKVSFTKNRKQALEGADFIINLVKIGFHEMACMDLDVPKKYGLKQTIGDTSCLAGVFRALRTMPFCMEMCKEIEEVSAPGAVVLNYTNPQAMIVMACAAVSRVPFIGLCHSVQGTTRIMARMLNLPYEECRFESAGINHMSWITTFEHKGQDVYPKLRALVKRKGIFGWKEKGDVVQPFLGPTRLDMLNRTGYVVTESSVHFAEYVPYYLRTDELAAQYKVSVDQYKRNIESKTKTHEAFFKEAQKGKLPELKRSVEYGSQIIHSMVTGTAACVYANVMNQDLVTNLPRNSCVEIACLVNRNGVQPCRFGELPTVLAALNTMEINVHQLAVEAILKRSRRAVVHALMMDPLTHSMMTIDQMEDVVDTLVEKQKAYLGKYLGKKGS
ncbi:MAG: Alpha-galactosidase [candidate division BRC1 bacterium ADurb.BinA364]|nr:MAG: Alpha-galactosidase [candidate division BRC1 bacterium ADurb.BinA364]